MSAQTEIPVRQPVRVREAAPAAAKSADTDTALQLTVDWTRCQGHGLCAAAFGEQIGLDRWGFPDGVTTSGVSIPESQRRAAKMAVATCPAVALRLQSR